MSTNRRPAKGTESHRGSHELRIAPDLTLPIEAVTETFAILAKRGVGKTYTGAVLAEEMLGAGAQVVILDPLDAWWGLRSSADGNGSGLPIYVFGGEHGDVALEPTAGDLLADVVVDNGISAILSLRHLSKAKQLSFVAAFAERLYHRKGEPEHRTPLHVFIDEADAFVPQKVFREAARTHGAIDDLVRRGRSSGIGVTLISQRAAVVSKDVLTQCEVLIALRTISPQDRKALDAWVEAHDAHDQRGPFMESLATLAVGEAWVWSPGWLDIFERIGIRERTTFDSSFTPKAGARPALPAQRVELDVDALDERIKATRERAESTDPRKLQARIAELERLIKERPTESVVETVVERVEVPVLNGEADELRQALAQLEPIATALLEMGIGIRSSIDRVAESSTPMTGQPKGAPRGVPASRPARDRGETAVATLPSRPRLAAAPSDGARTLSKAERSVLSVLAQYPDGLSKGPLTIMSGYSYSGGFRNTLSALRTAGYIVGDNQATMAITEAGLDVLGPFDPLPVGRDLLDYWLGDPRLGKAERAILGFLAEFYPEQYTGEQLAPNVGYEYSGGFRNNLSKLRTLGLIEGSNTTGISASAVFFT